MPSRKTFNAVAEMIREEYEKTPIARDTDIWGKKRLEDLAENMADYFKSQNHRFDRRRFYDACGMEDKETW